MSAAATRLSPALKALLAAPYARGSAIPAPPKAVSTALFEKIGREAKAQGVGEPSWLVLSTAALVTSNSPAAVCDLYSHVTKPYESSGAKDVQERVARAAVGVPARTLFESCGTVSLTLLLPRHSLCARPD